MSESLLTPQFIEKLDLNLIDGSSYKSTLPIVKLIARLSSDASIAEIA